MFCDFPREYAQRVTVALIVIGVIAFLVIDVVVIGSVLRRHRSADDYGTLAVPGEMTVSVPAGKVKLTYQESRRSSSDEHEIHFSTPQELEVKVTSETSGELQIKGFGIAGMGTSRSTGGLRQKFSRDMIGAVEVPAADTLTITARPELPDAVEPRILIGK